MCNSIRPHGGLNTARKGSTKLDSIERGTWAILFVLLIGYFCLESVFILLGYTDYQYLYSVLSQSTVLFCGLGGGIGIVGGNLAKGSTTDARASAGGFDDGVLQVLRIVSFIGVAFAVVLFVWLTWF